MRKIISKNFIKEKRKYLPSKKFLTISGITALILLLIVLVSYLLESVSSKIAINSNLESKKAQLKPNTEDPTVLELVQKDSDDDGVYDWEEALWGTNKHNKATFGVPDRQYIDNKKKELKINNEKDDKTLTETDQFAREFFTAYIAMQDSGNVDSTAMQNFASTLGNKIIQPDLVDKYTEADIKTTKDDNFDEQKNYYKTISDLFAKYQTKGMGDELSIVGVGLENYQQKQTPDSLGGLDKIAEAYKGYATDVINTPVPESFATYHLRIANGANNTGISVANMTNVINDPIVGVSGVSGYDKYSNDLASAVSDLEDFLNAQ